MCRIGYDADKKPAGIASHGSDPTNAIGRVTPETFERRRLAYHHTLQEEYFAAFEVTGTRTHTLRPGDSLWYLAERKYQVPIWLIRQYNPDVDFAELQAGKRLTIPVLRPR